MAAGAGPPAFERWLAGADGRARGPRLALVLLGGYALFIATYLPLNVFSIGRPAHRLWLPGEQRIPFVPGFEFLYVLTYVLPLLPLVRVPAAPHVRRAGIAFLLVLAVAYATYLAFPVTLDRPALRAGSLATWLLSLEYRDPSYNHFPSLHVAMSWLVYLLCCGAVRHRVAVFALIVAIAAATLFVKQHYLVDVLYGTALAWGAWGVAARFPGGAARGEAPAPPRS